MDNILYATLDRGRYYSYARINHQSQESLVMIFEGKPEKSYNAEIYYADTLPSMYGGNMYIYEVYITDDDGKVKQAVRRDNIYLFETKENYNNWYKNNNKDMESSILDGIDSMFNAMGLYRDQDKKDNNFWDNIYKNEDQQNRIDGATLTISVQNDQYYDKHFYVSQHNNEYSINGVSVDYDTFKDAVDIILDGGKYDAVSNSINDVLNEYNEEKKKKDEEKRHADELAAKKAELEKQLSELQDSYKELQDLQKKMASVKQQIDDLKAKRDNLQ